MGFDLSLHHVRTMTAELLVDPVCLTLRFEQSVPAFRGDPMPDSVELSVFVTKDQDAADAYMLAAAINAGQASYDTMENRRIRAAICLGWKPVADPKTGEIIQWERPWREGDVLSDNPMYVATPYMALKYDLDFLE